jgi:hypothetical protein
MTDADRVQRDEATLQRDAARPAAGLAAEEWEETLDGFRHTLRRQVRVRDISIRIVRSTSEAPELRHLWANDITFEIEHDVPFAIIERALARLPSAMLGPPTLAFVRQSFGP